MAVKSNLNNERLEFLGDSVLSLFISDLLYKRYPKEKEGFLSKMRSRIVNRESLNDIAKKIGIDKFVDYDKSIKLDERNAIDLFGNTFEAFVGAIYYDKGFHFTEKYLLDRIFRENLDLDKVKKEEQNYKGRLFEYAQKEGKKLIFEIEDRSDGNETMYLARVLIDDQLMGEGNGFRKKTAEQEASKVAFRSILKNKT